LEERKA